MIDFLLNALAAALDKITPKEFVGVAEEIAFVIGSTYIIGVLVIIWLAMFYL